MCGRYTLVRPETAADRFGFVDFHERRIPPRFNIAPTQEVPVIVQQGGQRQLRLMQWGFLPAEGRPAPINARAETLAERPLFRPALARGRCLIPADGFYEWRALAGRRTRQPMLLRLKGGELFAFAGLYAEPGTFLIVTTTANELVAPIHSRMPAILEPEDEDAWLAPDLPEAAALACLRPLPAERMEAFPVSSLVSSVQNDGPELIEPDAEPVYENLRLF